MPPRYVYDNPNYAVEIKKRVKKHTYDRAGGLGEPLSDSWARVTATMPEEISMRVAAQYEAQIANFLSNTFGSIGETFTQIQSGIKAVFGTSAYWQGITQQLWIDSDPFELELTLNFDADTDAAIDVMEPTKLLQSWVLPTTTGDYTIESPAPTVYNAEHNRMVVHLGRFMTLSSVILTNADVTYSAAPDANGNFIAATASISLRTSIVPSRDDFLGFFSDRTDQGSPGSLNLRPYFQNTKYIDVYDAFAQISRGIIGF